MSAVFRITSCLLLLGAASVFAQGPSPSKEAPPKPPLLVNAPTEAQWTITYSSNVPAKKKPAAEDPKIREMRLQYSPAVSSKHIVKGHGQMVIYTTFEADLKSEAWLVGKYLYTLPMREGHSIEMEYRRPGDFPEISWVTAANFRGTVKLQNKLLHLYETDEADPRPKPSPSVPSHKEETAPATSKTVLRRAYIDPETRLPAVVEVGKSVMTYEFSAPPAIFPVMDERISQQSKPAQE